MNTKQIQYAIEVARTLNFNKAAENLFISQPALSYQIKILEEEIGFKVFNRKGKSIRLTSAGKQFIKRLTGIQQELNNAIEEGQNIANQYKDSLTIAYPTLSCLSELPEIIQKFNKKYPDILINPIVGNLEKIIDFEAEDIDIAFTPLQDVKVLPEGQPHFLYRTPIYVMINRNDPLSKKKLLTSKDFRHHTLLVNGASSNLLKQLQRKIVKASATPTLNSPDYANALVNVAANKAVCLTPGYLKTDAKNIVWIPFKTQYHYDCYLITHSDDEREITREFVQMIKDSYKKD